MHLKDYYTILELPPSASPDEIKKSYRRLAHLYHPDKKRNDPYAAAKFSEIKEAYDILSHPYKKEVYLQQRWYEQSAGRKKTVREITPEVLLKQMLEFDRYIRTLDIHRMDREGMYQYLSYLLSSENIDRLNGFNEPSVNKDIILLAIKSGHLVPYDRFGDFIDRLSRLNIAGTDADGHIKGLTRQRKQSHYWERRRVWIILLAVIVICIGIFLLTRN